MTITIQHIEDIHKAIFDDNKIKERPAKIINKIIMHMSGKASQWAIRERFKALENLDLIRQHTEYAGVWVNTQYKNTDNDEEIKATTELSDKEKELLNLGD